MCVPWSACLANVIRIQMDTVTHMTSEWSMASYELANCASFDAELGFGFGHTNWCSFVVVYCISNVLNGIRSLSGLDR